MDCPLRATRGRLVVRRAPPEDVTKGGIVIPKTAQEKLDEGWVVSVGADNILECGVVLKNEAAVDDYVIFTKFAGREIAIQGDDGIAVEYVVVPAADILTSYPAKRLQREENTPVALILGAEKEVPAAHDD